MADFRRGRFRVKRFRPSAVIAIGLGSLVFGFLAYRGAAYFGPPKPLPLPEIIKGASPTFAPGNREPSPKFVLGNREPISARNISVIDGDTIRAHGRTIRLIGFNAPESGDLAQCALERETAARAAAQLGWLVAGGGLDLRLVRCSCPPGTEGASACNYGRSCGELRSYGRDIGAIMIAYRLAHPYVCGANSCPPPKSWC